VRRTLQAAAAVAVITVAVAGCGNQPLQPPDLTALGKARPTARFVGGGGAVTFTYPRSWVTDQGTPPRVAGFGSGSALVSIYAYPRVGDTSRAAIVAAKNRLRRSLQRRAPGFLVKNVRLLRVDGSPAVQIRGRGIVGSGPVATVSTHVYKPRVEWVIDAYATPDRFDAAERIAFAPLLTSIHLADRVPQGS
jgi:hypothetical protein